MKTTAFLFCIAFMAITSVSIAQQGIITKTSNKVEVVFTNQMTQEEFVNIQDELKAGYMIEIEYTTTNFDEEGNLTDLAFTAKTHDGQEVTYSVTEMKYSDRILLFKNFGPPGEDSTVPNFGVGPYQPDAAATPVKK